MIELQAALDAATSHLRQVFQPPDLRLEEIEKDTYKGRNAWLITLSYPDLASFNREIAKEIFPGYRPRVDRIYKTVFIDEETGAPLCN